VRVLVTGASGFIGRNLCVNLARMPEEFEPLTFDVNDPTEALEERAGRADFVCHLAGVNRPTDPADFERGNADLTRRLLSALRARGEPVPVLLASSTQAALDNPYGQSKRAAEEAVFAYAQETHARAYVFRFPGVFGKWCRPFYNSVVATFCHQAARGEAPRVDDPDKPLSLLYIDDLVDAALGALRGQVLPGPNGFCEAEPTYTLTLGGLADTLQGFASARAACSLTGDRSDPLLRKLYATFLSYLPEDGFAVPAMSHADARGDFAELIRSPVFGQISVSRTVPGVTRGQHWHNTKVEKFVVVRGEGVIRFRKLGGDAVLTYPVSGARYDVVDIPPGYTHSIENTGAEELTLLVWAGELYDPQRPDTYLEEV
jgi:UDP-2-acetamido-2,6-beta-L-arabino-hexul-4-ose reductase